jgi:hypothetical protein
MGSINLLQLLSRFSWALILIRAMLEPLVNLLPELETPMLVLCWALERLFSRYAHGYRYSRKLNFKISLTEPVIKEKKTGYMHTELDIYFFYRSVE